MATNLDRGSNDLEEIIDRLEKQKQFLKLKLEQASSKIQKLKHANAILENNLHSLKNLHNAKVLDKLEDN